jgi:hypothetical protein
MMNNCRLTAAFCLILFAHTLYAQETAKEDTFKITGKPIIKIFADYEAGLGEYNQLSGFRLTRTYLGYQFKFSPTLDACVIVDAGSLPSAGTTERKVYLKNAYITWKDKGFTVNAGLVGLRQHSLQESFWNHRYVLQTYQDLNSLGQSADMGVTAEYKFNSYLFADLSISNGEGYKQINSDNKYRYAAGLTFRPNGNFVFRVYSDRYRNLSVNQSTLSFFGGYTSAAFLVGAEYNYQSNSRFIKENEHSGYSFYTSIPLKKKWNVYGRYDHIHTDGSLIVAGFDYSPVKQLRISPNYRYNNSSKYSNGFHEVFLSTEFTW